MARRGGGQWRVPGNPMAGMMRDAARQSRKGRRPRAAGPQEREQPDVPSPAPASPRIGTGPGPRAVVVVTNADGRASWTYSSAFPSVPVVTATVQAPAEELLFAVIEVADRTAVTVRVWRAQSSASPDLVVPAGADIEVHVTAMPVRA